MASQPSARCTIAGGVDCAISRVNVDGWRKNGPAHRVSVHVNDSKISHPAVSAGPFAQKPYNSWCRPIADTRTGHRKRSAVLGCRDAFIGIGDGAA